MIIKTKETKETKNTKKINIQISTSLMIAIFLLLSVISYADTLPSDPIQLVVDGKNITELSSPVIEKSRVLVPLRFISEELGADVYWDDASRTVRVNKDSKSMHIWIGSHVVEYNGGKTYNLSDVAPKIINDRTYVPLRLVSNALGIGIEWDANARTVYVDSSKTSNIEPFYDVKITSHKSGDTISGNTEVQVSVPDSFKGRAKEIKLLLLDKNTAKGFVLRRESQLDSNLAYLPKIEDKGEKILAVAIYDFNNKFIGGESILVNIDVKPQVFLTGVENSAVSKGTVTLGQKLNFLASYVRYELTNLDNGKVTTIDERDPQGSYSWTPSFEKNGSYAIKVIAYDGDKNPYPSKIVYTKFAVERRLSLSGVSEGMTISKSVNLIASRNFDVMETEYIMIDSLTGIRENIATIPYGSYKWLPDSKYSGDKKLLVRVKAMDGLYYESDPVNVKINVNIDENPKLYFKGIGPRQVLTGSAKLTANSNVELDNVSYTLTNTTTGVKRNIGSTLNTGEEYTFTPLKEDSGEVKIQAEGIYQGKKIVSEVVSFKIYLGTLYGPKAVIAKDKFLGFASTLAKDSLKKTGMSAALQTAQAILETGWGQSVPVDKYDGKFSNNLFGIKGSGTNGSVISNTWEVYNGVSYRTDANFRAYNNVGESWNDHKSLLLNASRYEPFRDVMFDSTLGAWAIRRAGYATDPQYPIKLMKIIKQYNLQKLDEVGIGQ